MQSLAGFKGDDFILHQCCPFAIERAGRVSRCWLLGLAEVTYHLGADAVDAFEQELLYLKGSARSLSSTCVSTV